MTPEGDKKQCKEGAEPVHTGDLKEVDLAL